MKDIDISKIKHAHFIGIGGIGISAIARMMALEGKVVTGNDLDEFEMVGALRKFGVDTKIGTDNSVIPKTADLIVYSIAWNTIKPEILEYARTLGVPVLSYPEMLGVISKEKFTIAVSGTHGKTTTTAMIAKILLDAGLEPTVIVGSSLKDQKSNFIAGKSKYFVVEACEYKRSFLNLHPNILVITNIDDDHLDYYKDIADIQSAFRELASRITIEDYLVCNPSDENIPQVISGLRCAIRDYSLADAKHAIHLPGDHNKKNAGAALAVASILGIEEKTALNSLNTFSGTWRRFEYRGKTIYGADVYDDYAHHPTEIKATLSMARELFPSKKITVAFQPHLYSRTKDHLEDFADAFKDADNVLLAPIYAARESFDPSISSEMVAEKIRANHRGNVRAYDSLDSISEALNSLKKDEVLITMGAGDINTIANDLATPVDL